MDKAKKGFMAALYELVEMAADLYADGDADRIRLESDPGKGNMRVFVDGKLVDTFGEDASHAMQQRIKGLTNRDGIRVIQMPKEPRTIEPKGAEWNASPGIRRADGDHI